MTARIATSALIDTNILFYMHDPHDRRKQRRALDILRAQSESGAMVSTQVLGELYWSASRKLSEVLAPSELAQAVRELVTALRVVPVTQQVVLEALRGCECYGFPYWDAQIWAAARLNRIDTVLSEDFPHGREIEGVRFENPFRDLGDTTPPTAVI